MWKPAVAIALTIFAINPTHAAPIHRGPAGSNCIALTFDDGPDPHLTPQILEILANHDARATFFLVGRNVEQHPEIVRQMVAAGHEIGNHSWSHPRMTRATPTTVRDEIARTDAAIYAAVGFTPAIFRPPYGATNGTIEALANRPLILWTFSTLDWLHDDVDFSEWVVSSFARPGAIVLMHDVQPVAVAAMGAMLDDLEGRGFGFATVSDLLAGADCRPIATP